MTAIVFSLIAVAGLSVPKLDAQCTQTTAEGVNGRCVLPDDLNDYICLEDLNKPHCFISGGGC